MFRITIIYDNRVLKQQLKSGWGFSCLIEGGGTVSNGISNILFDTGANGLMLLRNMRKLRLDPDNIKIVFISHGHQDHAGGLYEILKANHNATVYIPASPAVLHRSYRNYRPTFLRYVQPTLY